jgi:transcriptional regulator with XRE-family HTH domain
MQTFAKLLAHYMDDAKPKISANKMGNKIGISRQAVLNWRNGTSMPDKNHRDKVLTCAHCLGLTERQASRHENKAIKKHLGF